MLLIILLVLLLVLVQAQLPARYLSEQVGAKRQMGPRDDLPEPSHELARARRALGNLQETLPIFLTLAVLSIVLGRKAGSRSRAGRSISLRGLRMWCVTCAG